MLNQDQKIPCPVCKTPIHFDTYQLLSGTQFKCTNCDSSIGLSAESRPLVEETMKKFEDMKHKLGQGK